ncbi:MAG TPA: hypothetical protein VLB44_17990 [Kofleriaceae bacterium]|nr:hypothetical protein [Kofleriaceae bacterium]
MRNCLVALAASAAFALGCGDNSRSCGPGTIVDDQGFCVPTATCGFGTKPAETTGECVPDGSVVCSDGTKLDPLTGTCQIDPTACQNGTVLIDAACVDPALGTVADLNEGPEPNGLGVIEPADSRAGNVILKGIGQTAYVIHGTIDPYADRDGDGALDPDVDTYVIDVDSPALLQVSADGVHGINAGFLATSPAIAGWKRYGINLAGDTSLRQVYLPEAGTYWLSIADTRTLFEYADTGTATAAPGGDDGDYYVAVTELALPAPTAITTSATGMLAEGSVAFYSAVIGPGMHPIALAMPSAFAIASLVVEATGFFAFDDEDATAAKVTTGSLGTTLIVVDHVYDVSPSPVAYSLTIQ